MNLNRKMEDKTHKKHDKRITMRENGFIYHVELSWNEQGNTMWNEACADVIQVFGLPGNKFMTYPTMDSMLFGFKSDRDATLCRILLSERLNS